MSTQPFRDPPLPPPTVTLAVRPAMSPLRVVLAVGVAIALYVATNPHALALAVPVGVMIIAWGRQVRLEVTLDPDRRELHVDSSIFGAFRKRTTTDLAPYSAAEPDSSALSDTKRRVAWKNDGDWVIMLVTPQGERTLLERWSASLRLTRRLAQRIDDALHPQRAILAPPASAPTAVVSCRVGYEYGLMAVVAFAVALFASAGLRQGAPAVFLFPVAALPFILVRAFPWRLLRVYDGERQVELVTSYLGFFPDTQRFALDRVQRVIVDRKDVVSQGAALLLDDGHHVPLTLYSNASFGIQAFVTRANAALGKADAVSSQDSSAARFR
jgi:hypothetical protein